ncbi:Ndc1p [Sporobolomyces koalae]|uniref:Ndc1p n=1 Tax=Sporobolomyces koalae TaxID=500713 RepID=UPI0031749187
MSTVSRSGTSAGSSSAGTSKSSGSDFLSTPSRSNLSHPSTQSYATLCKVVLARRMRNMLSLAALTAYSTLLLAVFDPKELPGSLLNFLPVIVFAPIVFLGSLPLFVLRKQTISLPRPSLPTRFSQFAQLRQRSTLKVFLSYLAGAGFFHIAYIWCAGYTSTDPRLGLFFYHQGRDTWQLNERRIILALLHTALAAAATVEHVVKDRSQVQFEHEDTLAIPARLAARAVARFRSAIRSTSIAFFSFWIIYVVARRPVLRFILVNFAGPWARPHLYTIMKHSGAYSFTLALRAVSSSFMFFVLWEATHIIFEVYATQPMSVSQFASNPNQSLLSGLRSDDPYYQQFAYHELATLTLTSPARREAIFKDVKRSSSSGGAWSELSRECLVLIGTELQRAKGRGRIAVTATGVQPSSTRTASGQPESNGSTQSNKATIKSGDVFVPTKSSFFDRVSATASNSSSTPPSIPLGPAAPLVDKASNAVSSAVSTAQSTIVSRVPSILQTASLSGGSGTSQGRDGGESQAAPRVLNVEDVPVVVGIETKLAKWVPGGLRAGWFEIVPEYRIARCLTKVQTTVCAIQALSNLTCASLKEDSFGVAQRDIPKILEGYVRFLTVLDSLEREFELIAQDKEHETDGKERAERWRQVEKTTVGIVQDALRHGARSILTEFAPYLTEFRFPTQIAAQLQLLVDWGA